MFMSIVSMNVFAAEQLGGGGGNMDALGVQPCNFMNLSGRRARVDMREIEDYNQLKQILFQRGFAAKPEYITDFIVNGESIGSDDFQQLNLSHLGGFGVGVIVSDPRPNLAYRVRDQIKEGDHWVAGDLDAGVLAAEVEDAVADSCEASEHDFDDDDHDFISSSVHRYLTRDARSQHNTELDFTPYQ